MRKDNELLNYILSPPTWWMRLLRFLNTRPEVGLMRIAQFKDTKNQYELIGGQNFTDLPGYIRVSEWVEVEFTRVLDFAHRQVSAIDEEIAKIKRDSDAELARLNKRKAEFSALPALEEK